MDHSFPSPLNDQDFERFCRDLLKVYWRGSRPEKWGRNGQKQFGVDVIDMNALEPLRGAQVKWKKSGVLLTAEEVECEVAAARGFDLNGLKLGAYFILTTSENDTNTQGKVVELNHRHRNEGLFVIELLTWESIEEILRESPLLWEKIVARSTKSLVDPIVHSVRQLDINVAQIGERVEQISDDIISNRFRDRLEAAKSHIEKHEYQEAWLLLQGLRNNNWHELSPVERFRVLTNLGCVASADGRLEEAGQYYCEAQQQLPDDERAKTGFVAGLVLLDQREEAYTKASQLTVEFPNSLKPWVHLANTAPDDISAEELEKRIPQQLLSNEEILVGLALRAARKSDWLTSFRFADTAISNESDWPAPWLFSAHAKVQLTLQAAFKSDHDIYPADSNAFADCLRRLDKAIELSERTKHRHLLSRSLLARSRVHDFLGNVDQAERDLFRSRESFPSDPELMLNIGTLRMGSGHRDEAIQYLRKAVELGAGADAEFLLAGALRWKEGSSSIEWWQLAERAARISACSYRYTAIDLALQGAIHNCQPTKAIQFLEDLAASGLDGGVIAIGKAFVFHSIGDKQQSATFIRDAVPTVKSVRYPDDVAKFIAEMLTFLGEFSLAMPLWESIGTTSTIITDARSAVWNARRVKRYDIVRRICKRWREAGCYDGQLIDAELDALNRFAPQEAVTLVKELLVRTPENSELVLRLATLGVQLGEPQLISGDPGKYPSVKTVGVTNGTLVAICLAQANATGDALLYSYRLLRKHVKEQAAHASFIHLMLAGNIPDTLVDPPPCVSTDSAVKLIESGTQTERWFVLESENGTGFDDEIRPDDSMTKLLLNKSQGESVLISGDEIDGRRATIQTILSKYVFRLNKLMSDNQILFPTNPMFQMVRIEGIGDESGRSPDFTPIIRRMYESKRHIDEKLAVYRNHFVPIQLFANSIHRHFVQVMEYLASTDDLFIRCSSGDPSEGGTAASDLRRATECVVDLSAITTLRLLTQEHLLKAWPVRLVVSTNTLAQLRLHREEFAETRNTGHIAPAQNEFGIQMIEVTSDQRRLELERVDQLISTINSSVRVLDCWELAEVAPTQREQMIELFGQHGAESIVLASRGNRVLWTDDQTVGQYSRENFHVRSVWTQMVFQDLALRESITRELIHDVSAKLIGFDYQSTLLNAEVVLSACKLSDWNAARQPLRQMLEFFSTPIRPHEKLRIVTEFLRSVYSFHILRPDQEDVMLVILDRIAEGPLGTSGVTLIESNLSRVFGINIIAERMARMLFANWHRLRH